MGYAEDVRRRVDEIKTAQQKTWKSFMENSSEYQRALKLDLSDMAWLKHCGQKETYFPDILEIGEDGFLPSIEIEGEKFALAVRYVDGSFYSQFGLWSYFIMAVCLSDRNLNTQAGNGNLNLMVNVIPEEWHKKLICELSGPSRVPTFLEQFFREDH